MSYYTYNITTLMYNIMVYREVGRKERARWMASLINIIRFKIAIIGVYNYNFL